VSTARIVTVLVAALALAGTTGCGRRKPNAPASSPTSALDARIKEAGEAWKRYSPEDQALIKKGDTRVGLDELAVYVARGKPEMYWHSLVGGKTCSTLLYSFGSDAKVADTAITACEGTVTRKAAIDPPLPCWRLAEVAPRMVESSAYFDQLELPTQWKIVQGILERGLTAKDVRIAFGKPYNTGTEAREDHSDATTLVFLDRSGESYALNVTLVDEKVVAWKIPAERVLTPEAQQKHAQLAAKQAVDEARAQDQAAAAKHAEEARLRNEVQARSTQFLMDAAGQLAAQHQAQGGGGGGGGGGSPTQITSSTKQSSQEKTLTLNGCTYRESGGGALGQSCKIGGPGCPASYTCNIMAGSSGVCVPSSQSCGKKR
jgi:hypothetical protein